MRSVVDKRRCEIGSAMLAIAVAIVVASGGGCAHTVVIETEPMGARVKIGGEPAGDSPVISEQRSSTGGRLHLEVSAEGYETQNVVVTQSDWFLWPLAIAAIPVLGVPFVVVPFIGPLITLGWAAITSPSLIALAFLQKYPERVKVTLRPRMRGGVLQPTDTWLIPDDMDPNPPPLPDSPPPPIEDPALLKQPPQPAGGNPVP